MRLELTTFSVGVFSLLSMSYRGHFGVITLVQKIVSVKIGD